VTYSPKKADITHSWHLVDLEGKTLGRVAARIAHYLRGKHKPQFANHLDCGDYIVAINADKIKVTGSKMDNKIYYKHTGYHGSLTETPLKKLLAQSSTQVIKQVVAGMIPRNRLSNSILNKLKVFPGPDHTHAAQKPAKLDL